MKTKLVYVLTCSEDEYYIEQALMSVFSARHWNPDAHIVLLVDDQTNCLLVGKRAEILNYVSEKIVVPFEDATLSPMYRSRWIKTSVRQLIKGDFLFVDCDTIVCKNLKEIDSFDCEIGCVWESHLLVEDYCQSLHNKAVQMNSQIGVNIDIEKEYFSSGVMFVKDTPRANKLYELWHCFWEESQSIGVQIDQPALAKANREMGHIIRRIPDVYNCILFTRNDFVEKAYILHVAAYKNPSYLFTERIYGVLKHQGLQDWIKEALLHPCDSMLPFDYSVRHSSIGKRLRWIRSISETASVIKKHLPEMIMDFPMQSVLKKTVVCLFSRGLFFSGACVWMMWKHLQVLGEESLKDNIFKK